MRSQWYCALNENCHFANTTTVENKHCTHHLKQSGTKCKKIYLIYGMCLLFVIFRCPYTLSAAEQRVCFERWSTSKGKYQFFLLFLLTFTVLTHFAGPSVVYIVSLIYWMCCFWESSSLLPGRIGKIMVYFVLASENWNLSDKERVKKAHWLCFRLGVFWCLNPRTYNEGWLPPLLTWEDQRLSTEGKIVWKSPPPPRWTRGRGWGEFYVRWLKHHVYR